MSDSDTKQKAEEEEEGGLTGILPAILSMAASVGGMIPSLFQGPQQRQLEAIQRGGGAGAAMARQTASEAARRTLGASTARPSSGRAGNLREGLRAAEDITQRGAQQAAITGAQEANQATARLRHNEMMRRSAFRTLGAGVGQGLAGIGGTLALARDQGEAGQQEADQSQGERAPVALAGEVDKTGLSQPGLTGKTFETQGVQGTIRRGEAGLQRLRNAEITPSTLLQQRTTAPTGQFSEPGSFGEAMSQARETDYEPINREKLVAAQQQANLKQLADTTASKQSAAETYRANTTGSTKANASTPPPSTDPGLEIWLYQEAQNYNPITGTGINPVAVLEMLITLAGVPAEMIDYAALGIDPQLVMSR